MVDDVRPAAPATRRRSALYALLRLTRRSESAHHRLPIGQRYQGRCHPEGDAPHRLPRTSSVTRSPPRAHRPVPIAADPAGDAFHGDGARPSTATVAKLSFDCLLPQFNPSHRMVAVCYLALLNLQTVLKSHRSHRPLLAGPA